MFLPCIPQLQSHALRMFDGRKLNGVFVKYCSSVNFIFDSQLMSSVGAISFLFIGIIVSFAPIYCQNFVQKNMLPDIQEEKAPMYTYKIFWGITATAYMFDIVVLYSDINSLMTVFSDIGPIQKCLWAIGIPLVLLLCMAPSIYCASNYELAIPDVYLHLVQYSCCTEKCARLVVASFTIWINLVAVELLIHHGVLITQAMQIAPYTVVTNVLFLVLVGTCVILINVAIFTTIRRNFLGLSLLFAFYGVLILYNRQYGNTDMENVSYLILLHVIILPILIVLLHDVPLVIKMHMHWFTESSGHKVVRALFSKIKNDSSSKNLSAKLYQSEVINFQCLQQIQEASSDTEANAVLAEHLYHAGTNKKLQDFAHILIESDLPKQKGLGERIEAALADQEPLRECVWCTHAYVYVCACTYDCTCVICVSLLSPSVYSQPRKPSTGRYI